MFSDRWILLFFISIVIVIISSGSLAFRQESGLPNTPLGEDAFYSFSVARNLALGNGLTIDGEMLTNGFQPLYTIAVVAPIFYFNEGDRISSLRWLFLVNTMIIVLTAFFLAQIVFKIGEEGVEVSRRYRRAFLTALLYVSGVGIWRFHFNGLETGFLLLMYSLAWLYYQRIGVNTALKAIGFGTLLGAIILTRIDAVFFVLVVVIGEGLFCSVNRRECFVQTLLLGIPAFIVASPWFAYNYWLSGSFKPSSGIAQEKWGVTFQKIYMMFEALVEVMTPAFFLGQREGPLSTLLRVILIVFICYLLAPLFNRQKRSAITQKTLYFAGYIVITYLILIGWYLLNSVAVWFYPRYLAPLSLLAVMVTTFAIDNASLRVRQYCMVGVLVLSLQIPLFVYWHHTDRFFRGSTYFSDQLVLANEHVPKDAALASDESGTIGYFRDHVVNLDGKVNFEAIRYRENLPQYLDKKGIKWFITRSKLPQEYTDRGWKKVAQRDATVTWYLYSR